MGESTRESDYTCRVTALLAAPIVAIGLVSTPTPAVPETLRPVHVQAIQLQAIASELTAGANTPTAARPAAATPQANASLPAPETLFSFVLFTAAVIALTPVWYAAFPITVPASIVIAAFAYSALSLIGFSPTPPSAPAWILQWGLVGWAVGPLVAVREATRFLVSQLNPAAAVSNSSPVAESTSASQASRQDPRAKRGLAGSRRTASANATTDRTLSAHRPAKKTPTASTGKKRTGTAGSARAVSGKGQS